MPKVNSHLYPSINDNLNARYTRQRIHDFISKRRMTGVKPNEIWESKMWKSLNKTRQWGHRCLNILEDQNLIFEHNHKYYPVNSNLNNIYWFASTFDYQSQILICSIRKNGNCDHFPANSTYYTTPIGILESRTRGPSPPSHFCKTQFSSRSLNEQQIFEFANRIGAFITYIFIQSMKPSTSHRQIKDNHETIKHLLAKHNFIGVMGINLHRRLAESIAAYLDLWK
jgi:hypothetical protein